MENPIGRIIQFFSKSVAREKSEGMMIYRLKRLRKLLIGY